MARSQQATSRGGDQPLALDRLAIKSSNRKPLKHLIGMEMHVRKPPRLLSRRRTWRITRIARLKPLPHYSTTLKCLIQLLRNWLPRARLAAWIIFRLIKLRRASVKY